MDLKDYLEQHDPAPAEGASMTLDEFMVKVKDGLTAAEKAMGTLNYALIFKMFVVALKILIPFVPVP